MQKCIPIFGYNFTMDFLNRNLRILNITHCDLDGAVSGIVIKRFYATCDTLVTNYGKEKAEQALEYIKNVKNSIDGIVFTDFSPIDYPEEFTELNIPYLILDHHETALSLNNPKEGRIITTKCCGAMLAYKYFTRKAPELECLKELVELTNDYDLWIHKDVRSKYLNTVFWIYYGFHAFYERFKTGFNGFTKWEKGELLKQHNQLKKIWDELVITDLPHKGCLCVASTLLGDIGLLLEKEGYEWYLIYNDVTEKVHLRSRRKEIDVEKICTEVLHRGGGHSQASSCSCTPDEVESITNQIVEAVNQKF